MPFSTYAAYSASNRDEMPLYLFDQRFSDASRHPSLGSDYTVPGVFGEDLFALLGETQRPDYRWGPRHCVCIAVAEGEAGTLFRSWCCAVRSGLGPWVATRCLQQQLRCKWLLAWVPPRCVVASCFGASRCATSACNALQKLHATCKRCRIVFGRPSSATTQPTLSLASPYPWPAPPHTSILHPFPLPAGRLFPFATLPLRGYPLSRQPQEAFHGP